MKSVRLRLLLWVATVVAAALLGRLWPSATAPVPVAQSVTREAVDGDADRQARMEREREALAVIEAMRLARVVDARKDGEFLLSDCWDREHWVMCDALKREEDYDLWCYWTEKLFATLAPSEYANALDDILRMSPSKRRVGFEAALLSKWAESNPVEALEVAMTAHEATTTRSWLVSGCLFTWGKTNPVEAFSWASANQATTLDRFWFMDCAKTDPQGVLECFRSADPFLIESPSVAASVLVDHIIEQQGPRAGLQALASLPEWADPAGAVEALGESRFMGDDSALDILALAREVNLSPRDVQKLAEELVGNDSVPLDQAAQILAEHGEGNDEMLGRFAMRYMDEAPLQEAIAYAHQLGGGAGRGMQSAAENLGRRLPIVYDPSIDYVAAVEFDVSMGGDWWWRSKPAFTRFYQANPAAAMQWIGQADVTEDKRRELLDARRHEVQAGETLDSIARRYGLTTAQILHLNPKLADSEMENW